VGVEYLKADSTYGYVWLFLASPLKYEWTPENGWPGFRLSKTNSMRSMAIFLFRDPWAQVVWQKCKNVRGMCVVEFEKLQRGGYVWMYNCPDLNYMDTVICLRSSRPLEGRRFV
jgi:hypothetical protein